MGSSPRTGTTATRQPLLCDVYTTGKLMTDLPNARQPEFITKKDLVAGRLREMVVSGELKAGSRIRQQKLADEFGVSATPVREAIRQLEAEGYLQSRPHVGVQVAGINREGLQEIYQVRMLIEGWLARRAAHLITHDALDQLRTLASEFEAATVRDNLIAARRANYGLHRLIWELADAPVALEIVNSLWAKFPWDLLDYVPGRDERSVDEHHDLVAALEAKDPERAEAAIHVHIRSGRADYTRMVEAAGNG